MILIILTSILVAILCAGLFVAVNLVNVNEGEEDEQ